MLNQLVSYLAHPSLDLPPNLYAHTQSGANKQMLLETYAVLRLNGVLFRVLNSRNCDQFQAKSNIVAKLIDESVPFRDSYDYMQDLRRELLDVVARFNEQSIDCVFIKSLNALPLDSDNFDVLIRESDLHAAIQVLKNHGFVEIAWGGEPYKWLFRNVEGCKHYMAIHLHTAVAWGGIEFIDVKDLWKKSRRKQIEGVSLGLPSPEHHLLITVAHAFFENRQFSLGDLAYIIQDVENNDIDWNYTVNWAVRNRWFDSFFGVMRLADHIYRATFGEPLIPAKTSELLIRKGKVNRSRLAEELVNRFDKKPFLPMMVSSSRKGAIANVGIRYVRKIITTPDISFLKRTEVILRFIGSFAKRRIPLIKKHPAFLVCFMGQDGTGKTTHAKCVWKELKRIDKKTRVRYLWSRGFGYSFQPFLVLLRRLLLGNRLPKADPSSYIVKRTSLLNREPMQSLWAYLMIVDHLIHLAGVRLALSLGYIVICDRWISDTLIDVKCDLGKPLGRFLDEKLEHLVPKPKIAFVMDTKTSELAQRKPQINPNLLERKRCSYLEYSHKKGFKLINTDDDFERNRQMILSKIITIFFSQFK